MLTYMARPRVFRHEGGKSLCFPAECQIRFHLKPDQPFGITPGGGRTFVQKASASAFFNANNGQHTIQSDPPLSPLDVTLEAPDMKACLSGSTLTLTEHCDDIRRLEGLINHVYFGFPWLLNINFADPPYVERVDGTVADSPFRWELLHWDMQFGGTTQQKQEERFAESWEQLAAAARPGRRRLLAALHYFHVACRLARAGSTAGEFVAEVVLNLAKTLEVLFPPTGDGRSRDAVRKGLTDLGYESEVIERDFVPAMALRNELDVGHVELGLFTLDQLSTVHRFTERAEWAFRQMFQRLLDAVDSGQIEVAQHDLSPPRTEAVRLIERLRASESTGPSRAPAAP